MCRTVAPSICTVPATFNTEHLHCPEWSRTIKQVAESVRRRKSFRSMRILLAFIVVESGVCHLSSATGLCTIRMLLHLTFTQRGAFNNLRERYHPFCRPSLKGGTPRRCLRVQYSLQQDCQRKFPGEDWNTHRRAEPLYCIRNCMNDG